MRTFSVSADLSMEELAATLVSEEQLGFEELKGLAADATAAQNLAEFDDQPVQPGGLAIVASDGASEGKKFISATVYIGGAQVVVDVYRLPV